MTRAALRLLSRLLFAGVCLVVAGVVAVLVVLPRTHDTAALTVLSGSMTPDIPVGAVVVIRPVDPATLEVGDVVTYQIRPDAPDVITHRIIDVRQTDDGPVFELQGDANRGPDDEPVPAAAIRGELWFDVPHLGSVRDGFQDSRAVATVVALLLGGYAAGQVWSGLRDRRRQEPAASEQESAEESRVPA